MTHKLHQILAVETGEKNRATKRTTELYKLIKKTGLFKGFVRTYKPRNDEDIRLPDERTEVQYTVKDVVNSLINEGQAKLWDLTATRDWGNTHARADIVVGDQVLVENAPVPFLLFLEQRLNDLYTFVSNLPVLDKAQKWDYDKDNQLYRSRNPVETIKTQKVQAPLVKYEATPDHPA
ncbi:MAG: hypothetical protein GWO08_16575, partial [Gammaproteobacteria bacterium]|nr:hypothetical protein [Gammaproteobacteria bacterium]